MYKKAQEILELLVAFLPQPAEQEGNNLQRFNNGYLVAITLKLWKKVSLV